MRRFFRGGWGTAALFAVCVLTAFFVRTWHYNRSVHALAGIIRDVPADTPEKPGILPAWHRNFAPFTIESAMMFAYAQDIAEGKGVPARDPLLNGMEDIPPYGQMIMLQEWFLGWGWRIKNAVSPDPEPEKQELRFQDHPRMAQWMSGQLRLWTSLTSGLLFLWMLTLGCRTRFAFPAALLHAFSPAAIARATGQDIVRGEFCMPFIAASLLLVYSIYRAPKNWKYVLLFCSSALAFASWDLCQMLFSAWAVYEIFRFALGRSMNRPRVLAWAVIAAAAAANAAFVPFHHYYSLWRAQLFWVCLPTLFLLYFLFRKRRAAHRGTPSLWKRGGAAAGLFCGLYLVWALCVNTPEYASNYSHFSEMMKAKLTHWNVKPLNPSEISYDARILWTPSMHSATWETATTFFPSLFRRGIRFRPLRFLLGDLPLSLTLYLLLAAGTFVFTPVRLEAKRRSGSLLMPVLFTAGFLIGFIYIVRYHEFLILFLAVSLALLCQVYADALRPRAVPENAPPWMGLYRKKNTANLLRHLPFVLFLMLVCYEICHSCTQKRFYTGDVALADTAGVIEWMRREPETFRGRGVAANLTTGPMLRAYAGTGVVMNPQFGLKRIRDATEEYLNILYHGSEEDLADYCRRRNAKFVLFRRTDPDEIPVILSGLIERSARSPEQREQLKMMWTPAWIYSNRYIADALTVPENAVCRLLYRASDPAKPEPGLLKKFRLLTPPRDLERISRGFAVFELAEEQESGK